MSQIRLLARTFFSRLFESDLMPDGLPQVQLVLWGTMLAGMPTTGYVMLLRRQLLEGDRLILIALSMIAMGIVGLVIWDNVFPDRRDVRILGPLPVPSHRFVVARFAALGRMFLLFAAAICVPHSVMFGMFGMGTGVLGRIAAGSAHLVTVVCACTFVMCSLIAAQCLMLLIVGRRSAQAASAVLQVTFALGLAQLIVFLPALGELLRYRGEQQSGLAALMFPPLWFFRQYQWLLGSATGTEATLGQLAGIVTLAVLAGMLALYAASYNFLSRRALEGAPAREGLVRHVATKLQALMPGWFIRPVTDAVRLFSIRTMMRYQAHRMMLSLYAGMALALVLSAALSVTFRDGGAGLWTPGIAMLAMPLMLQFLLLIGMRVVSAIPAEPKARWVFRAREPLDRTSAVSGLRSAMMRLVVWPTVVLAALQGLIFWSVGAAVAHALFCFAVGRLFSEVLMTRMNKLPFACTYYPGRSRVLTLWPFYLILFFMYCFVLAAIDRALITRPMRLVQLVTVATIATQILAYQRRRMIEAFGLRFEEEEPNAIFRGFDLSEGLAAAPRPAGNARRADPAAGGVVGG